MNYYIMKLLSPQAEGNTGADLPSNLLEIKKKGAEIIVDETAVFFPEEKVTARQILEKAGKRPAECFSLFRKQNDGELIRLGLDEIVDLRSHEVEHFVTKPADVAHYLIDDLPETTERKEMTPVQIMEHAGINAVTHYLVQLDPERPETVYAFTPDEPIKMSCSGMRFLTRRWIDRVDIEDYGKTCTAVPPAKEYLIRVDKTKYPWHDRYISGSQIIGLEIKNSAEKYTVLKFLSNSPKPVVVAANEKVDLTERCLLRFVIQPKTQDDGYVPKNDFSLCEEDKDFLEAMNFRWETFAELRYNWLLIYDYPIPEGYDASRCTVALMVPPAYPATEIDMAYFSPLLRKRSGRPISATISQSIGGKPYQRWSRHRKPGEWKPGVDNLNTHLTLVNNWLVNDLKR
jgi:hypothetical protein